MALCALIIKNFKCYTRLEMIVYLTLPLLLLQLVRIRSYQNKENMSNCYIHRDNVLGDLMNLNALYNAVDDVGQYGPDKIILLATDNETILEVLPKSLIRFLDIREVIECENEKDLEERLVNGNYIAGIIWKNPVPKQKNTAKNFRKNHTAVQQLSMQNNSNDTEWLQQNNISGIMESYRDNTHVMTIRFPSVLRSKPSDVWGTAETRSDENQQSPIYRNEGFLQLLYAIILTISKTNLLEEHFMKEKRLKIFTEPFVTDEKYENQTDAYLFDPIKSERQDILLVLFSCMYFYPFIHMVLTMSTERQREQKELIRIAKGSVLVQYIAYFISTLVVTTFIALAVTIMLKAPLVNHGPILTCSSFTAIFVFLLVWSVASICFGFMLYALIHSTITLVLAFGIMYVVCYSLVLYVKPKTFVGELLLYSLFHAAFLSGINWILEAEEQDLTGLQWKHYKQLRSDDGLDLIFGAIPVIMLCASLVCLVLCIILEDFFPGKYGIARSDKNNNKTRFTGPSKKGLKTAAQSMTSAAVVQVSMLNKRMGKKALKKFSMNMYDDQITVLLGLSDSCKSAVMNAIAGTVPASSGWVKVDGKDIIRHTKRARRSLGFCPQHDPLFSGLTVKEHFDLYSQIGGSTPRLRKKNYEKYVRALQMEDISSIKARHLSSCDKRKLAVICAFANNPRLVLLDEPSERMDIESRRLLWCLLLNEKICRTIIISTYNMEEADFLADRIGIIYNGEMLFNGTAAYLKSTFGSGYRLICNQGETNLEPQLTAVVMQHIPQIHASVDAPKEVSYNISRDHYNYVSPLLVDLESRARELNTETIGIGTTSTLEKFVSATSLYYSVQDCKKIQSSQNYNRRCLRRNPLISNQWRAMFLKKFYHIFYNKCLFISLVIFAIISFVSFQHLLRVNFIPPANWEEDQYRFYASEPPLVLDPSIYKEDCIIAFVTVPSEYNPIKDVLRNDIKQTTNCKTEDISLNELNSNRKDYNEKYAYALEVRKCQYFIYYSRKFLHSQAVAAAMLGSIALRDHLSMFCEQIGKAVNARLDFPSVDRLVVIHHPYKALQYTSNSTYKEIVCYEAGVLYLMLFCLTILSSYFAAYIIKERVIGYKFLQYVEGMNVWIYWFSHLLYDSLLLSVIAFVLTSVLIGVDHKKELDELAGYMIVLLTFNLAALPFIYLLMYAFKEEYIAWILPSLILSIMIIPYEFAVPGIPFGFLYFIPHYTAIAGMHSVCIHANSRSVCHGQNDNIYLGCSTHPHLTSLWPALPFAAILLLSAVIYFLLLICSERRPLCGGGNSKRYTAGSQVEDCQVMQKVCYRKLTLSQIRNNILLLRKVTSRRKTNGIDDVSMIVKPMDVLGLVGTRAGKSKLIELILCRGTLRGGAIFLKGINVHSSFSYNRFRTFRYTGYCPQKNYFDPDFTGRQTLRIFSLIRGIPVSTVRSNTKELAENLNFKEHLDKPAWKYTVSDKRKLSTAIAANGSPPLIILDEPTGGLERAHRPDMLDFLKSVHECGSAIILASRNIEDFEILCTHLAFLEQGRVVSVGPVENYRRNDSNGLTLQLKIRPNSIFKARIQESSSQIESATIQRITDFLLMIFQTVILLERNPDDVIYYIYNSDFSLAQAFQIIEENRVKLNITDFFLKQESLELSFAGHKFPILP